MSHKLNHAIETRLGVPKRLVPGGSPFGLRIVAICLAATVCLVASPTAAAQTSDGIAAVVNADPISEKSLTEATVERFGQEVLDNMINRHLILQACKTSGIEVTSSDVRTEIQRTAAKFKLAPGDYLKLLEDERGISPEKYSREIIWPMLALRRLVAQQIQVTPDEFNKAYLAQYGEAVKCRMIMTADKSKALSLRQQAIANPKDFANLAKQFSEDESSASVGGLIPPIRRFTGDAELENAVFGLGEEDISEVMNLGEQWIILQSVRKIAASVPKATDMPLIREQIEDQIKNRKMQGAAQELFAKLQADAQVVKVLGNDKLAAQYPGAAAIVNGQQVTMAMIGAECLDSHGLDVLEVEITRKLLNQVLKQSNKTVTQDDLANEISRAAISLGFIKSDGSADIGKWFEAVTQDGTSQQVYLDDAVWPSVALRKLVEDKVTISESDLKQGFESSFGPRVEVLAIVLSDQRTAQKVWEMARDNPTAKFFGKLAEQYSVEPVSSGNSGMVPPIRKHGGQPAIEREAFAMKPGDLSGIIATGDKYIVLRCLSFTEPVVTDFEVVKEELVRDITDKKTRLAMTSYISNLVENSEIDNFFELKKNPQRRTQ